MPFVNNNGVNIHYQVEGQGPAIVMQHGYTQNLKRWYMTGYVEALKDKYQLILIDARGHGQSDKLYNSDDYLLELRASDVVAVLDDLGVETAIYWGFSMGGRIGFALASLAPERISAFIIGGSHPYARMVDGPSTIDGTSPEAFIRDFYGRIGVDFNAVPKAIQDDFMQNDFRALAASWSLFPDLSPALANMTTPCLIYCGTGDGIHDKAETCAAEIPQSEFVSIARFNHAQTFNISKVALQHVVPFLERVIRNS